MTFVRILVSVLFLIAGSLHLIRPRLFLPIMPPWIPFHMFCVVTSGVAELAGGLGLLLPNLEIRWLAGLGLLLLLVAVFPANVYMAVTKVKIQGVPIQAWMSWVRIPLQPVIMMAVAWVSGVWPS